MFPREFKNSVIIILLLIPTAQLLCASAASCRFLTCVEVVDGFVKPCVMMRIDGTKLFESCQFSLKSEF